MQRSRSSLVSLPFLPNLLEIEFLGLSFDNPEGLEVDVELVLGEDLGGDWGLGFLLEFFLFRAKVNVSGLIHIELIKGFFSITDGIVGDKIVFKLAKKGLIVPHPMS